MKSGAKSSNSIEDPAPTHTGWLGICPILIANAHSDGPDIYPRHWSLDPLLTLVVWYYVALFSIINFMLPNFPCSWPIRITGKVCP